MIVDLAGVVFWIVGIVVISSLVERIRYGGVEPNQYTIYTISSRKNR
jgi:hypothetical protein